MNVSRMLVATLGAACLAAVCSPAIAQADAVLNGQYTVWGQVVEGMELVDGIAVGEPPANPDKILSFSLAE